LTGLVSAGNYDVQFIDCIIRGLTLTETYFSVYGGSFFRRCNFKYQSINALQSNTVDVILENCINIPDDLETTSPNYYVNGSAQYVNDHYYLHTGKKFYLTNNFVDLTPTLDNELTSKSYVDTEINTKQDTITDGSLTIARTDGLLTALNEKQATITTSTDLTCNKITTSSDNGTSNIISGFELKRFSTNVIQLNSNIDGGSIIAYNKNTGICAYQALSQVDFRVNGITKLNATNSGVKIGSGTATEALDVAGNILASGSTTASSAIVNGVNINTTLTDILARLELLENA
jgi:hypothetical protein